MTDSFREVDNPGFSYAWYYSLLVRAMAYVYAFQCFAFVTADPDLWGHIKFGEAIWTAGAIPKTDHYSFTANGFPWTNHEWLAEVIFFLIYRAFDSTGLLVFKLAIGLFIVYLLSSLYWEKTRNGFSYIAHFVLMIPVLGPGFMSRPQLFTYLCLALLIYFLQKFFDGNERILMWTPPLALFWVNCHAGVVAGMGIYGMVVFCELIRCYSSGESRGKTLLKYFSISCLAILFNPYGYKLLGYFYNAITMRREIEEWNHIYLWDASHWQYKLLALIFVATFWSPARKRAWEVVIIAASIYYGFKHQRHSVLTAIVMTPYIPLQLAAWLGNISWKQMVRSLSPVFHGVICFCLMLFVAFEFNYTLDQHRKHNFRIFVEPQVYPVYVVRFMQTNSIDGNIVNPFDWGEYLIWKLPKSKVSIDGRYETVYTREIMDKNWGFSMGLKNRRAILEDYSSEIILTRRSDGTHRTLDGETAWVKIHEDPTAALYVRNTPRMQPVLRKFYAKELVDVLERPSDAFP